MSRTFRRLQTCTLFDNFAHCLQISFTFSSFLCFCVKKSSIIFSTFWCTVHSSIGSRWRWPQSNLSAENDIYSNLSLSLINLGGVACFKLGKMGKNWISLKDYIGGELFGPFLHPCVRPIAEDIPALIFSSRKVIFFFKTKLIFLTQELSAASTVDPRYGSLDRHPPSRYDQALWFKFNFFPFSCETQSSLSSLAPCQTLPRYAASLIWKLLETNSGHLAPLVAASTSCSLPRCSTWSTTYPWSGGSSSTRLLF